MEMIKEFVTMTDDIKKMPNNSDKILRVLLEISKDIKAIREFGVKKY